MAAKSAVDRLREAQHVARVVGGRAAQRELDAARKAVREMASTETARRQIDRASTKRKT
ncbi:MAG: hypothetical protein JWO67_1456 [Streptosporangiaceae bacterium]|nr:hypothetical protein [Streptosporangiaceae bacterium]